MTKLTQQAVKAPTAEDLVRAIQQGPKAVVCLAVHLGILDVDPETAVYARLSWSISGTCKAIADLVSLDEPAPLPEQDQAAEVGS